MVIMASGSEVALAMEAAEVIGAKGQKVRVVSFPSVELFEAQDEGYKDSVIPSDCTKLVSIEAGSTLGWYKYIGRDGLAIGIDRFGASAPAKEVAKHYGINVEDVVKKIEEKWGL
jgi:transketolase